MTASRLFASVVLLCGVLVAGCGVASSEDSEPEELPSAAIETDTGAELDATEGDEANSEDLESPGPVISHSWTDSLGYSFTWKVFNPRISITTNTEDQLPGKALVRATVEGEAEVTNDTPGRNARPSWAELRPAFKKDSLVCGREIAEDLIYEDPRGVGPSAGYCYLAGPREIGADYDLAPGESHAGSYTSYVAGPYGVQLPVTELIVDEAGLEALVAELREPDFWLLFRGVGEQGVSSEVNSLGQNRCRDSAGATVVQTSEGGVGVCEQGVQ